METRFGMGTANVTESTLPRTEPPRPRAVPRRLLQTQLQDELVAERVGALRWLVRRGGEGVLQAAGETPWGDPAAAGWLRVKENTRREVWRAEIAGRVYYAKYFFQDPALRRLRHLFVSPAYRAEWNGGLYALRYGISATRPVGFTADVRRSGRRCAVLVTEATEPAYPLSEFWQRLSTDPDVRRRRRDVAQLTESLAELIARAHQAGFEHLDMHAANILVQVVGPRLYRAVFVDLQSARLGAALSDRAVMRNLAQLNQWFRRHASVGDRLRFLRAYFRWRNELEGKLPHGRELSLSFAETVAGLNCAARRHAWRLWAQRDRRVERDGRYFCRLKLGGGWRGMAVTACKHILPESPTSGRSFQAEWWRQRLAAPLSLFHAAGEEACKDSHSAMVCRTVLPHPDGEVAVIIKRPRARNWRRRLAQWLRPSRSWRGWGLGHALLHRNLTTARPLAVLQRRFGPLVVDSLLITEAIPGACELESWLKAEAARCGPRPWARLKREVCTQLVRHLRRFHERGFVHRDCKASNVLVVPLPRQNLAWVDMDGVRRRRILQRSRLVRALSRLHVSLLEVPGLTRTDRVRFLKAYFAGFGVPHDEWRRWWPALVQASDRKRVAQSARRAWKRRHYGRE